MLPQLVIQQQSSNYNTGGSSEGYLGTYGTPSCRRTKTLAKDYKVTMISVGLVRYILTNGTKCDCRCLCPATELQWKEIV